VSFLDVDVVVYIFYRQQGGLVDHKSIFVCRKMKCAAGFEIN
jgi:hypothetical protein